MNKNSCKWFFLIVFINLIFFVITIVNNNYSISPLLPILPLLYLSSLVIFFMKRANIFKSISVLMILGTFFIRIVVVPAIYVLANYSSKISISSFNINDAIILQIWEYLWVFVMILFSKKISNINKKKEEIQEQNIDKTKKITKIALIFLLLIAIICVISDKNVMVSISTIFNRFFITTEETIARRILYLETKSKSSLLFNVFLQVVFYLQILIPAYLISILAQKKNKKSNKGFYGILLVSIASTFIVTDNNIDSICIMIACLIVLYNLYESKMKKILPIICTVCVTFVILFLFSKTGILNDNLNFQKISEIMCAYFAALPNIGISFSMNYTDKLLTFFGDIIAGVPYLMAIFKNYPQSLYIYNETIYGYKGYVDQIMPMVSYGYQYFNIFAPILTIITYNIAFSFEIKSNKSNNAFSKVLYSLMFTNLSVGPCIFGFPNTIKRICLFIPLIILIKFNEKNKNRNVSYEKK